MISYKKIIFLSLFALFASVAGVSVLPESAEATHACTADVCVPGWDTPVTSEMQYFSSQIEADGAGAVFCLPVLYGFADDVVCVVLSGPSGYNECESTIPGTCPGPVHVEVPDAYCENGADNPPQCTLCVMGGGTADCSLLGAGCTGTGSYTEEYCEDANGTPSYGTPVYTGGCTCVSIVYGCTDPSASNYNPSATDSDGSCLTASCGNGATNPPACSTFLPCGNGATNPPACSTFLPCGNGATNPPECTPPPASPPAAPAGGDEGGGDGGGGDGGGGGSPSTAPTVSITLAPSAAQGAVVPMSYSSTDATSCSSPAPLGISNTSGSFANINSILSPGNNTIQITCTGPGGSDMETDSIQITVPSVDISANPARVRSGSQSQISWTGIDVSSCNVTGPSFSSSALSSSASRTITAQSLFSITCEGLTDSVTVNIVPIFQEF